MLQLALVCAEHFFSIKIHPKQGIPGVSETGGCSGLMVQLEIKVNELKATVDSLKEAGVK